MADIGYTVDYSQADPFDQRNVGNYSNYCPTLQQRNLRGNMNKQRKSRLRKKKTNSICRQEVLQDAANNEMAKIRSIFPPCLPKGMECLAGESLTVYILDEDDEVKEETVKRHGPIFVDVLR